MKFANILALALGAFVYLLTEDEGPYFEPSVNDAYWISDLRHWPLVRHIANILPTAFSTMLGIFRRSSSSCRDVSPMTSTRP